MTTHRFGKLMWPDTPNAEGAIPMEVPVGEPCTHCEEPIGADDAGFAIPHIDKDGARYRPQHECCFIRTGVGSFAHVTQQCSCFVPGSRQEDPPGLTKRQAARLAVFTFFDRYSRQGGTR